MKWSAIQGVSPGFRFVLHPGYGLTFKPRARRAVAHAFHGFLPCLSEMADAYYNASMKTLTVRLPEALVAEIEAESRERRRSKSEVVRERLSLGARPRSRRAVPDAIADLVGSVNGLPADLSERKKAYLKTTGYGRMPAW